MYSSYVSGWTTVGRHHVGQPGAKSYQLWWPREAGFCSYIVAGHRHFFFFPKVNQNLQKKVKLLNSGTLRVIGLGSKVKGSNGFLANQQFLICEFFFVLFCLDDTNLFKDSSCWIKRRTWFQGEQILIKKYLELLYLELGKKVPWILKIDFEIIFFLSCLF